jgi:hypothetical protein
MGWTTWSARQFLAQIEAEAPHTDAKTPHSEPHMPAQRTCSGRTRSCVKPHTEAETPETPHTEADLPPWRVATARGRRDAWLTGARIHATNSRQIAIRCDSSGDMSVPSDQIILINPRDVDLICQRLREVADELKGSGGQR